LTRSQPNTRLGAASNFREKRKIDALTNLGRQKFFDELFLYFPLTFYQSRMGSFAKLW